MENDMRQLTEHERCVIAYLLSAEFDGAPQLREQLGRASVVRSWTPEGSPSFDISVPKDIGSSSIDSDIAPVVAEVVDSTGSYIGELILWLTDGKLSALEYSWVTKEPPKYLPEISQISISPR